MNRYRVKTGAVAKIGAGAMLSLSGQQIRDRAFGLELPKGYVLHAKDPKKEKPAVPQAAVVKSTRVLDFKAGEVFGIDGALPKNLAAMLEPLDAAPAAGVRPPPPPARGLSAGTGGRG